MNHIKFKLNNQYDVYSADALNSAIRPDIESKIEDDDCYHFRSEGDLQPIMDVCSEYELDVTVVSLNKDVTLSLIRRV